jgi:hypothetical protein
MFLLKNLLVFQLKTTFVLELISPLRFLCHFKGEFTELWYNNIEEN